MGEQIENYETYLGGMQKSLEDKLWFLDKIYDIDNIVDYGCADGTLLKAIEAKYPNRFSLSGIDNNVTMLDYAKKNTQSMDINYYMLGNLPNDKYRRACLNLSSVIHEVYSYCSPSQVESFWHFVLDSNFDYISIRDMGMSIIDTKSIHNIAPYWAKIFYSDIFQKNKDIYNLPGSDLSTIISFLLKYRYIENWDRESKENYLPMTIEEIILKTTQGRYRIKYFEHYTLPFLREQVKKDFDIDLNIHTHYKLLLEKVL